MEINNKIKEIMSSRDNLIAEINKNGFNLLEKYNVIECNYENNIIKDICFELNDNPLDTDWDWNGCITLLFNFKDDKISCQIQLDAVTDEINYSNYAKYVDYCDIEFNPPNFENETDGFGDYDMDKRCVYDYHYDANNFKSKKIFNKITKSIILLNKKMNECISTQDEIENFESKYYDLWMDIECKNRYDKLYCELTEKERDDLQWELDGIATYNQMVRDGWIDED
ncbi:hypothetical protein FC831_17085 [Clostridium botulinum]|nr:hypothetical protein [Clostridium botulinum]